MNRGAYAEMERCAGELLDQDPDDGLLWQLLAISQQRSGKDALHALQQAAHRLQGDSAAQLNLANAWARGGRFAEAEAWYGKALTLSPDFAEAHANLAELQLEQGRFDQAVASLQRAVALQPAFAEAHMALAGALRNIGDLDAAASGYRRALELKPEFAPALVELATVLRLQRRGADSERSCRRALEVDPKSTAALAVLAELRADAGQFTDAEELHRRIIAADENALDSWAAITRLRRMSAADGGWLATAERLLAAPRPARRELPLRYAIGKYFDDIGDFDRGFEHYRRANALSAQSGPPYDRVLFKRAVDLITRTQDRDWIGRNQAAVNLSERPVFIVGMLRSGTTLAEQILASHPQVFGAGELTFFGVKAAAAFARAAAAGCDLDFSEADLCGLAAGYIELLQGLSADAARVVNKFPTNFLFLGLIGALLPRARIIHMQRDPRDTCLSIYFQQFEPANTHANDLHDLAHYYGEYQRLMRHWSATLCNETLLHVPYEGLVEDPEAWSRRMLEFVGLEWDARCLDFHRSERTVVTASRWQVRQGISKSSVGRWRSYEKHLGPLAALRPET
jgi:tetratricopeptide (TPR) repeat protein